MSLKEDTPNPKRKKENTQENQSDDTKVETHTIDLKVCILWPLQPKGNLVIKEHTPCLQIDRDYSWQLF